jgi:methionyl-tRNA formyltransferase
MRAVLIGTVALSRACLQHLIAIGAPPVGVVTRAGSTFHADFADLATPAAAAGIPVLATGDVNAPETLAWIAAREPDVIFCFGWSQIFAQPLLSLAPMGVIGYHPTLLPRNRGRHPIIWALALGLRETGSTFFFMDTGADSGDILSQRRIEIGDDDDAGTLYEKLTEVALSQISEFVPRLVSGDYSRRPQNQGEATAWRKRGPADGVIDWSMQSTCIHNLVRALARPYPGATVRRGEAGQIVWRTRIATRAVPADVKPGRVLSVDVRKVEVKTGDGAIVLVDHELDPLPKTGELL